MVDFNRELARYKTELDELDRLYTLGQYKGASYDDPSMRQLWSRRATVQGRIADLENKMRKDPNDPQTRIENLVVLRNLDTARREKADMDGFARDDLQTALDIAAVNAANEANKKYGTNVLTDDDMKFEYRPSLIERADIVRDSFGSNILDPFAIGRNRTAIENRADQRIMNETIKRLGGELPQQREVVTKTEPTSVSTIEVNPTNTKATLSPVLASMMGQPTTTIIPPNMGVLPEHLLREKADPAPKWIFENGGGAWVDDSERSTDFDVDIKSASQPRTTVSTETTTSSPNKSVSTISTSQKTATPVAQPQTSAQSTPVRVGVREYYIPSNGFTSGAVTIDPVSTRGDNGGLQHAAMNSLYQPSNAPMSLGQLIAFSSILNGKKDFGGLADVTATMQNADKMNAYAAQQNIANDVQRLMARGRSAEEARYEALTNQLLANGQDRSAVSTTLQEYAKQADIRAGRELDAINAMGGDYTARGAFGYTPYGVRSITTNADGSRNININGTVTSNVPMEYANYGVYGAIKGNGEGTKGVTEYGINFDKQRLQNEITAAKLEAEVAKLNAIANGANIGTGTSNQLSSIASIANTLSKNAGPEAALKYLIGKGVTDASILQSQGGNTILGVPVGIGNPGVD